MITISVDDQINNAAELVRMMNEIDPQGEHLSFSDAKEALDTVKEKLPDVAWLDIEMAGMSGLELAMKIKELSPKTNIVFVTGHEKFAYQSYKIHASGFVLKPASKKDLIRELDNLRNPIEVERTQIPGGGIYLRVQCFGNFEVFDSEGKAISFQRTKSKELLAYLIDRRGALCSVNEICGILFEEGGEEKSLKSQFRLFLSKLRQDLNNAGAGDVLVKAWNASGIDTSRIDCDYYNYLKGDTYAVNSFSGEYMSQYSWAEMTLGELIMKSGADMYE